MGTRANPHVFVRNGALLLLTHCISTASGSQSESPERPRPTFWVKEGVLSGQLLGDGIYLLRHVPEVDDQLPVILRGDPRKDDLARTSISEFEPVLTVELNVRPILRAQPQTPRQQPLARTVLRLLLFQFSAQASQNRASDQQVGFEFAHDILRF